MKTKLLLVVLDGWGISRNKNGNAILQANPVFFNSLLKNNPHSVLSAAGESVGLLPKVIGNSEVGHLHIGAGRLVMQDLTRIIKSINNGSFFKNKVLINAMKKAKKSALHILGLVSDAGVHSHIASLYALLKMAKHYKIKNVFVHAITDGRDVSQTSAVKYVDSVRKKLEPNWKIATIVGRFYAMDRDKRWERTRAASNAMVNAKGKLFINPIEAIRSSYAKGETDEFIKPFVNKTFKGANCNEVFVFFNFRPDRAIQISSFIKKKVPDFFTLVQYSDKLKTPFVFPQLKVKNTLGEILSKHNIKQFRLAETEKWAHVTYFFNGLSDGVFRHEQRHLIPSPKVYTYDKSPKMSADKITKFAIQKLNSNKYDFMLVNFANSDMVGHTGKMVPTLKAIKYLDVCLKNLISCARKNNYVCIITADHGKSEQLLKNNRPNTAHTSNKVPFILVSDKKILLKKSGCLYNIAPTVLELMGIKKPKVMGESLIE